MGSVAFPKIHSCSYVHIYVISCFSISPLSFVWKGRTTATSKVFFFTTKKFHLCFLVFDLDQIDEKNGYYKWLEMNFSFVISDSKSYSKKITIRYYIRGSKTPTTDCTNKSSLLLAKNHNVSQVKLIKRCKILKGIAPKLELILVAWVNIFASNVHMKFFVIVNFGSKPYRLVLLWHFFH